MGPTCTTALKRLATMLSGKAQLRICCHVELAEMLNAFVRFLYSWLVSVYKTCFSLGSWFLLFLEKPDNSRCYTALCSFDNKRRYGLIVNDAHVQHRRDFQMEFWLFNISLTVIGIENFSEVLISEINQCNHQKNIRKSYLPLFVEKVHSKKEKCFFFQEKQMWLFEENWNWKGTIGKVDSNWLEMAKSLKKTHKKKIFWSCSLDRNGVYSPLHGQGQPWWRIEFPYS